MIVGIDEVGRGALAGPVTAAAICFNGAEPIEGLRDSKKLSPVQRERLYFKLQHHPKYSIGVGSASSKEIDEIGIDKATQLAWTRALEDLKDPIKQKHQINWTEHETIVDGNIALPGMTAIVKADDLIPEVMAASIYAKVTRDDGWANHIKKYDIYKNKGYYSKNHENMIALHGPSEEHRKTFKRVKEYV